MLSKFSVKKPFTVLVAIIIIIILGVISYMNMVVDLIPSMSLPYAVVVTTYPGASPELVETAVTHTIEQSLSSINNVKNTMSVSNEHMSIVIMEFTNQANMDSALVEMRESIGLVENYFPDEVSSPMILKLNPNMMPILVSSVYVEGESISDSSKLIEDKIIPELESVAGVASINASGLLENMVHINISSDKIKQVNDAINADIKTQIEQMTENAMKQVYANLPAGMTPDMVTPEMLAEMGMELPDTGNTDAPNFDLSETLTAELVSGILKGQNFAMPSGSIVENETSYVVRTGDKFSDIDEVLNLTIMTIPSAAFEDAGITLSKSDIYLSDIADILALDNSEELYAKLNGNDAVLLTIQKQSEYSTADVSERVADRMAVLSEKYENLKFTPLMDQGEYVNVVIDSIVKNLLIGAVVAIVILLLFLKSIRSTFIVSVSILLSVVFALVLMYFSGITMNILSMGGLGLGIGMLVDNSIVVIENIFRLRKEGLSPIEAALKGTKGVSAAITASTITTIIVFLPIVFTDGITRTLFTDMALTIGFSLVASLLVALTFVPMMSSRVFSSTYDKNHKWFDKFKKAYGKLLEKSLNHKWVVLLLVLAMLGGTVAALFSMNLEFFPATDMGQLTVSVTYPDSYGENDKKETLEELTTMLMDIEPVETVGVMSGGGSGSSAGLMGMMGSSDGGSTIYVLLSDDRTIKTSEVEKTIRDITANSEYDVSVSGESMDMTMLAGSGISVEIYGLDLDGLREQAEIVTELISDIEGLVEIDDGLGKDSPEIRISVDKAKAISKGLTVAQVFMAVNTELADVSAATTIETDVADYNIYVYDDRLVKPSSMEDIKNLEIDSPMGGTVKIGDVADVYLGTGFNSIRRSNMERYVTISASVLPEYSTDELSGKIEDILKNYEFPDGYRYAIGGEIETINNTFNDLLLMLVLAVIFIYLVMVAQFQSLLSPFIVMFTMPLAFTGGILLLWLCGMSLSVIAMIGLIMLAGIVVNNGIVFVDYVNQLREDGMENKQALITAGMDRIRPIIMTALTTIGALMASFFDNSATGSLMRPLAGTTIGGLAYATVLTLFVIPALYDIIHRKNKKNLGLNKTIDSIES